MQTVNERLRDESIAHAVWISRYSTGVAARMVKILNDSDAELTARLLVALDSLDPGSFTVTRLESLLASVREVNGAKAQALTINRNEVNSTVDLTLTKQSGTGNRFVLQNSGNAELPFSVRVWGSSTRQNVFEVGTSAAYLFYAQKTSSGQLFDVNGAINCTTLNQLSDRELKDNIQIISDATEAIRKMNGYTYTLKENGLPYAGVIAQEAMEAIPEAVGSFTHYGKELQGPTVDGNELREETRYLNVDYAAVTGLLVQVARETDDRVTALEEENTTLRENLATAGTRITTLENQVSELVALVRQLTGSEH
ncbi:tail fiber domain-containing protein [Escherichia coli]|uniref:tail fiber domain-containing protein n=3 Tax=Escherichia coli TaxID=562 RepID=UPI00039B0CFC|nr:tail fiber domain-containing protein [Escherichia coli]MCV5705278.1 tail fiber domain-containing protein [Escherichia coli]MCV5729748.1 tail fiber domain-containing protein [Escherichia coli]MCV5800993.1 tail fiber domain-containing protein [Escherichia coli]MCW9814797.1 tail fiber domain-containing protein [Escherichia coli]MCW9819432.1 tail fiber domain-containing protein [Escherichia coli]